MSLSLAELFYAKHPRRSIWSRFRRKWIRATGNRPSSLSMRHFQLETLEPRLLLSVESNALIALESNAEPEDDLTQVGAEVENIHLQLASQVVFDAAFLRADSTNLPIAELNQRKVTFLVHQDYQQITTVDSGPGFVYGSFDWPTPLTTQVTGDDGNPVRGSIDSYLVFRLSFTFAPVDSTVEQVLGGGFLPNAPPGEVNSIQLPMRIEGGVYDGMALPLNGKYAFQHRERNFTGLKDVFDALGIVLDFGVTPPFTTSFEFPPSKRVFLQMEIFDDTFISTENPSVLPLSSVAQRLNLDPVVYSNSVINDFFQQIQEDTFYLHGAIPELLYLYDFSGQNTGLPIGMPYTNQYDAGDGLPIRYGVPGGNACGPSAVEMGLFAIQYPPPILPDIYDNTMGIGLYVPANTSQGFLMDRAWHWLRGEAGWHGRDYLPILDPGVPYIPRYYEDTDPAKITQDWTAIDSALSTSHAPVLLRTNLSSGTNPNDGHYILLVGKGTNTGVMDALEKKYGPGNRDYYIVADPAGHYFANPDGVHYPTGGVVELLQQWVGANHGGWFAIYPEAALRNRTGLSNGTPLLRALVLDPLTDAVVVDVHSPVTILVTDPQGRRTGVLLDGTLVEEISDSDYIQSVAEEEGDGGFTAVLPDGPQSVILRTPLNGTYQVELMGTGMGAFDFDWTQLDANGIVLSQESRTGAVEPGGRYAYTFTVGPQPTISISDVVLLEGGTGSTTNATFTVNLSNPSSKSVTVTVSTTEGANNPATASIDYQPIVSQLVTFNPGETSKPVSVTVFGDDLFELDETFVVTLTNPTNARLSDRQGVGIILNDDVNHPPVLSPIGDATVSDGSLLTFTATATDIDTEMPNLMFSLANGSSGQVPEGATITPSGLFTWTPGDDVGPVTLTFDVMVSDGLASDNETIHVTVLEPSPVFFQRLGDLPGGDFSSSAAGVSSDGTIVVGVAQASSGQEGFRWTPATGITGLGYLQAGGNSSRASAVSADGTVVVGLSSSPSGIEAFLWTSATGMVGLGSLPGGTSSSRASGISSDGMVVVGSSATATGTEAFRWTPSAGMVGLGFLAGGNGFSEASGVSADGTVIVGRASSSSGHEAFRWTATGGMASLGDLPGGSVFGEAFAVSTDGTVVVGTSSSALGLGEAFRWTAGSGMVGLGDLPGGNFFSTAFGVSNDGSRVVGLATSDSGDTAFIWDPIHGMRLFQDVLVSEYGLGTELAGWRLTQATRISGDGRTIVGVGVNPTGSPEAWRVVLPPLVNLDVDGNGQADALSDGIVIIRHLFGFTGDALINGVVDPNGSRNNASLVEGYLGQAGPVMLDVDGNGRADALSDGILVIRYLFGFTGDALINGAVDTAGTRNTAASIESFLREFLPINSISASLEAESAGTQANAAIKASSTTSAVVVLDQEQPWTDLSLAYVQKSWVQDYVANGASLADEDEEELLIALWG